MKHAAAIRKAQKLKIGDVVEILWLDSGRDSHDPKARLVRGRCFGKVHSIRNGELTLAMDVSEDADGEKVDGGTDTYGTIWIQAILECWKLKRA